MTGKHEIRDTIARALCGDDVGPCKECIGDAHDVAVALAEAGYLASPRTVGRCGEPAPTLGIVTGYSTCALPAGHEGWHEDDAGAQWTQSPIEDLIEASSLGTPGAKALRASVSDERAQRAIDRANEIRAANMCECYDYEGDNSDCPVHLKTDDGAGASPAATSAAPLDPAAQAGQTIGSPAPSSPRLFELVRKHDVSGVTGTGVVADGVEFPDGSVALRWKGDHPSTAVWNSVESILAVHGHEGATVARWLDEA